MHFMCSSMHPFAVVDFLDGGGVAIVPCQWLGLDEDYCHWPPGRVNINKAVKEQQIASTDWPKFKVRILGKAGNVPVFF